MFITAHMEGKLSGRAWPWGSYLLQSLNWSFWTRPESFLDMSVDGSLPSLWLLEFWKRADKANKKSNKKAIWPLGMAGAWWCHDQQQEQPNYGMFRWDWRFIRYRSDASNRVTALCGCDKILRNVSAVEAFEREGRWFINRDLTQSETRI